MDNMVHIKINNIPLAVEKGTKILEAAKKSISIFLIFVIIPTRRSKRIVGFVRLRLSAAGGCLPRVRQMCGKAWRS